MIDSPLLVLFLDTLEDTASGFFVVVLVRAGRKGLSKGREEKERHGLSKINSLWVASLLMYLTLPFLGTTRQPSRSKHATFTLPSPSAFLRFSTCSCRGRPKVARRHVGLLAGPSGESHTKAPASAWVECDDDKAAVSPDIFFLLNKGNSDFGVLLSPADFRFLLALFSSEAMAGALVDGEAFVDALRIAEATTIKSSLSSLLPLLPCCLADGDVGDAGRAIGCAREIKVGFLRRVNVNIEALSLPRSSR